MRICFFSFSHPFDDMRILHKEAYSLAAAGHEVIHLAPGGTPPAAIGGVAIQSYPRTSPLIRALALLRRGFALDADVYHCNEVESWLLGLCVKLARPRTRIVFDVHEHYPSRFEQPHFPRWVRRPGSWVLRTLFQVLTPVTDFLVYAKRSVAPDFPARPGQGIFVFNYAAQRIAVPKREEVDPSIRAHFAAGLTAVHIGDFSRARGWPQLLQALATLPPHIRVVALGGVEEGRETLLAEATRLGVADRLTLLGKVPYEKIFAYLVCADCGLMLYQPGIQNHVYAFPMKMYDYMQAGLPLIGPRFAVEVAPVFTEHDCGILIDPASGAELATALRQLSEEPGRRRQMGDNSRRAAQTAFTWEAQAQGLLAIYAQLQASLARPPVL